MAAKKRSKKGKGWPIIKWMGFLFRFILFRMMPWLLLLGLCGSLLYFAGVAISRDSRLKIKSIVVLPPIALTPEQRTRLEAENIGKHILKVDLKKVAANLEKDPEIQSVEAIRRFPAVLEIHVVRREPLAMIRFHPKGKIGIISKDGMVLQVLPEAVKGFVLLEAPYLDTAQMKVGFYIQAKGFKKAAEFIENYALTEGAKTYPLEKVAFDALGNISLYFLNAPEIRMGREPLERMPALEKVFHLLADPESRKITYIDIQFDNVIVKKKV